MNVFCWFLFCSEIHFPVWKLVKGVEEWMNEMLRTLIYINFKLRSDTVEKKIIWIYVIQKKRMKVKILWGKIKHGKHCSLFKFSIFFCFPFENGCKWKLNKLNNNRIFLKKSLFEFVQGGLKGKERKKIKCRKDCMWNLEISSRTHFRSKTK